MTFNRILCPVVLSPASGEPQRYAAALASAYGARLFICHCAGTRSNSPKDVESVKERIKQLLEDDLRSGPKLNGSLNWEALVVAGRNPGEAIAAEAARQEIDLIVMSPKRRRLGATLLGSAAKQVGHNATCSALSAPPDDRSWVAWAGLTKRRRARAASAFPEGGGLPPGQAFLSPRRHG